MMNRVENIPNAWRISFRRRKSVRYFTPPDCRFSPGIKARNDSIINKLIRASSPLKRRRKEKGERRKERGEGRRERRAPAAPPSGQSWNWDGPILPGGRVTVTVINWAIPSVRRCAGWEEGNMQMISEEQGVKGDWAELGVYGCVGGRDMQMSGMGGDGEELITDEIGIDPFRMSLDFFDGVK